jgi:hypothetical protein
VSTISWCSLLFVIMSSKPSECVAQQIGPLKRAQIKLFHFSGLFFNDYYLWMLPSFCHFCMGLRLSVECCSFSYNVMWRLCSAPEKFVIWQGDDLGPIQFRLHVGLAILLLSIIATFPQYMVPSSIFCLVPNVEPFCEIKIRP